MGNIGNVQTLADLHYCQLCVINTLIKCYERLVEWALMTFRDADFKKWLLVHPFLNSKHVSMQLQDCNLSARENNSYQKLHTPLLDWGL